MDNPIWLSKSDRFIEVVGLQKLLEMDLMYNELLNDDHFVQMVQLQWLSLWEV